MAAVRHQGQLKLSLRGESSQRSLIYRKFTNSAFWLSTIGCFKRHPQSFTSNEYFYKETRESRPGLTVEGICHLIAASYGRFCRSSTPLIGRKEVAIPAMRAFNLHVLPKCGSLEPL